MTLHSFRNSFCYDFNKTKYFIERNQVLYYFEAYRKNIFFMQIVHSNSEF